MLVVKIGKRFHVSQLKAFPQNMYFLIYTQFCSSLSIL